MICSRKYPLVCFCVLIEPVCPVPDRLDGDRTVGGVNTILCPPGYFGGGQAVCLATLQWSNSIDPCIRKSYQNFVSGLVWFGLSLKTTVGHRQSK